MSKDREIHRQLVEALKNPDVFTRDATGEKFILAGGHLMALKGLDPQGRPIIVCDSETTPNAEGGQDVTVRPQTIRVDTTAREPGGPPG